jgi:hypothetical protein
MNDVHISIRELPDMETFELETGRMSAEDSIDYLKYEFTSEIDLIINGKNVLTDYGEIPLGYPAFAFAAYMTNGIIELLKSGRVTIPIYTMQEAVFGDCSHHVLDVTVLPTNKMVAAVSFSWTAAPSPPVPRGLPVVKDEVVQMAQLVDEVLKTATTFKERVDALAIQLGFAPTVFANAGFPASDCGELLRARDAYFA